jgi:hypothetical protein
VAMEAASAEPLNTIRQLSLHFAELIRRLGMRPSHKNFYFNEPLREPTYIFKAKGSSPSECDVTRARMFDCDVEMVKDLQIE